MPRKKQSAKSDKARVVAAAKLPTGFGSFRIFGIEGRKSGEEAVAIQHGNLKNGANGSARVAAKLRKAPLVRVHSQCLTGDVFTSNAAIAARNWNFRCAKLPRSLPACCSTCRRKAAASA